MGGYVKLITWFGEPAAVACDGQCHKAWGINNRPKIIVSDDEDDYYYMADDELGSAPLDPGTYEGDCAKPLPDEPKLNKWCVRECERSALSCNTKLKKDDAVSLPDLSKRLWNIPCKHMGETP